MSSASPSMRMETTASNMSLCWIFGASSKSIVSVTLTNKSPNPDLTSDSDETLLQYKQMTALENPTKHDLRRLRDWLVRSEGGDNFLQGIEREILHADDRLDPDQERASDLVTMSREAVEHDFFSRWLSDEVLDKFHSLIGRHIKRPFDEETGMYHYRKLHLRAVSHLVGVMLASVIPAASIFTLYFIQHPVDRLLVLLGVQCSVLGLSSVIHECKEGRDLCCDSGVRECAGGLCGKYDCGWRVDCKFVNHQRTRGFLKLT